MKKTLALIISLVLILSAGLTAYAAPGAFVQSPSRNKAPILVDFTNTSLDCFAELFITAYADRHNLDEASRLLMEEAYTSIAESGDLGDLCAELHNAAANKGVSSADLAVSDLFDIDYLNCEGHENHGKFTIKLTTETIEKFITLMQRVGDEWVVVESAVIEGEYLTFEADKLSTYAIVVNAQGMNIPDDGTEGGDFPVTGGTATNVFLAVSVLSAAGLAVVLLKLRKKAK